MEEFNAADGADAFHSGIKNSLWLQTLREANPHNDMIPIAPIITFSDIATPNISANSNYVINIAEDVSPLLGATISGIYNLG